MYWAAALTGAFVIGCQGVLYAFGSIVYPTNIRASGVGMASAVGRVGAMLGPAIAGQLLSAGFGAVGVISAAIPCIIIFSNTHVVVSTSLACTDLNLIT